MAYRRIVREGDELILIASVLSVALNAYGLGQQILLFRLLGLSGLCITTEIIRKKYGAARVYVHLVLYFTVVIISLRLSK